MTIFRNKALIEDLSEKQAELCSIFSNPRRVRILWVLGDRELSVGEIANAVGSSLQNISQHLGKMKDHNIVSSRREGQTIYYRIERDELANQCSGLLQTDLPIFSNHENNNMKGVTK